jgi:FkbM family methyltransferase
MFYGLTGRHKPLPEHPQEQSLLYELYPPDLASRPRSELEQSIQQRAQTVYLGDGIVLARVLTRYKLLLHTSDRGFAGHVMMDGFWEIWLTQFFARTLKPGMHVVDVGANYGYYTMLFADIVGPTGSVIAVEPNPAAAGLLRQSVTLNGFARTTRVVEAALGVEAGGSAILNVPSGEPKNAHLRSAGVSLDGDIAVARTNLDTLLGEVDRVDLIKIDAEGAEEQILLGMERLLHHSPPALVLEFNARRCVDPAGVLARLLAIYGDMAAIDFDSQATPVTAETVLASESGEDWLLYFSLAQGSTP